MEYSQEELDKIVAGTNQEVAEEIVLKNEELFREKKVAELKEQREEILSQKEEQEKDISGINK